MLSVLDVLWQYTVYPAFAIVQNARFLGVTLISLLLGFFFIRLSYRYIILPLVGSGDHLTDKADSIRKERARNQARQHKERKTR